MAGLFGAVDLSNFCSNAKDVVQILGLVLTIFKIAIPLIVVFYGAFDLGKAVMSGKDDDIKKNAKTLAVRVIAGIIIYLLPSIILFFFGLIGEFNSTAETVDFDTCKECLLHPSNCK